MSETNLLHYIQGGDLVDQLIKSKTYETIYADVGHLFPNCTPLSDLTVSYSGSVLIILSRLSIAQFLEMYDISQLSHITVINLRVGVASIGHKITPEFDDIALMTGHGWTVYEPVSQQDLGTKALEASHPTYIRITHRYVPSHLDISIRDGLRYLGDLASSITYFGASMIEAVGGLDPERQLSQYVLISDRSSWYLSQDFIDIVDSGASSVLVMEQSILSMTSYIDMIVALYPTHRIVGVSVGTDISQGDVIVDEYRDQWYGCDAVGLSKKL